MSTEQKQLEISEADFFAIKSNLRTYLTSQSQFSDYDFTGSAFNVLLDILAYTTHYTAAHANLAFSETFLDTANIRSNVVSRAKELGYVPRSKMAAKATIEVSFSVTGNPNEYIIPKGTVFTASSGSTSYTFVTVKDHTIENDGNDVFTGEIDIYQGNYTNYNIPINLATDTRYIIPSKDADTRFIDLLFSANSSTSSREPWLNADTVSLSELTPTSGVWFIKESFDGFYEIYFGDGILGKPVSTGNYFRMTYLRTDGLNANGAKRFTLTSSLSSISAMSIATVAQAAGGADKESVESIKFTAPLFYQAQKRAVTEDDYRAIILSQYGDIEDISIWGGEKNDPPYYGKVFMAIRPKSGAYFSNTTKESLKNDIISKYNIVSVRPEIVDADYIDVGVNADVIYNSSTYTPGAASSLTTLINTTITNYFTEQVNRFGKTLWYSELSKAVSNSSPLIKGIILNLYLEKAKEVFLGVAGQYTFNFNNAIARSSVASNAIVIGTDTCYIKDVPSSVVSTTGTLVAYKVTSGVQTIVNTNIGTVDYNTGKISIINFKPTAIVDDTVYNRLVIKVSQGSFVDVNNPQNVLVDNNVYTNERDQIIKLKTNGISARLISDTSIS